MTTTTTTTSSGTASDRVMTVHLLVPDSSGGTRLSLFVIAALAQYGPVWLWLQAIRAAGKN
jgi:hypothetical protein